MKKIFSIAILVVLCFALCACSETATVYDKLNQMAKVSYTDYSISVKHVSDGETLNSSYAIKTENGVSEINYSYEVLNSIEEVDGSYVVPTEYKSTKSGSATVQDGKIVKLNGEELNVDVAEIDSISLKFDESYFEGVSETENGFTAKVKNVDAFLGRHIDCSDMTVAIEYTEGRFGKVTVAYTANGASIEIEYQFK